MIKGVIEDVNNYLGDKFSGVMYPTFIISWLITNWKIWYITFFMSESVLFEKTGCLKIEYIINQGSRVVKI
jgi:hypothetical protein